MFVTVITDCCDANASARQITRYQSYLGVPAHLVGLNMPTTNIDVSPAHGELEAATQLIDVLDAAEGRRGVVVLNVAPRQGQGKHWPNGTPFGYFHYQNTLVLSTIDGLALSLVKKLNLTDQIHVFDIPTVIPDMIKRGYLAEWKQDLIVKSQFRSFEFLPRAAKWLTEGIMMPTEPYSLREVPDAPPVVSYIDNFGNCVTTLLPEDVDFHPGKVINTKLGPLTCYDRMKDVPNGEPALIIGSWGLAQRRWLAVIIQGRGAAAHFGLKVGDVLLS